MLRTRLALDLTRKGDSRKYKNLRHCFKSVRKNESFIKIYSGFLVSLFGVLPHVAISFTLYDTLKDLMNKNL